MATKHRRGKQTSAGFSQDQCPAGIVNLHVPNPAAWRPRLEYKPVHVAKAAQKPLGELAHRFGHVPAGARLHQMQPVLAPDNPNRLTRHTQPNLQLRADRHKFRLFCELADALISY
jgi:hypothetical protein